MAPIHPDRARILEETTHRRPPGGSGSRWNDGRVTAEGVLFGQESTYSEMPRERGSRGGRKEKAKQKAMAERGSWRPDDLVERESGGMRRDEREYEREYDMRQERGYEMRQERGNEMRQERGNEKGYERDYGRGGEMSYEKRDEKRDERGYEKRDERGYEMSRERGIDREGEKRDVAAGSARQRPGHTARDEMSQERTIDSEGEGWKEVAGSKRKRPSQTMRMRAKKAEAKGRQSNERDSEGEEDMRSSKRAKHNHLDGKDLDLRSSSSNGRPRHGPATPTRQGIPHTKPTRSQRRQLNRAKTYEHAANCPKPWDTQAWRELAKEPDYRIHRQHAFVYRYLRSKECPVKKNMKEWKVKVHREMEELGFVEVLKSLASDGAVKLKRREEAEVLEKEEEEEEDVLDDGCDIDIYGDEETRAKYEPWIKSLTANT
jgi:hypothetical protein